MLEEQKPFRNPHAWTLSPMTDPLVSFQMVFTAKSSLKMEPGRSKNPYNTRIPNGLTITEILFVSMLYKKGWWAGRLQKQSKVYFCVHLCIVQSSIFSESLVTRNISLLNPFVPHFSKTVFLLVLWIRPVSIRTLSTSCLDFKSNYLVLSLLTFSQS